MGLAYIVISYRIILFRRGQHQIEGDNKIASNNSALNINVSLKKSFYWPKPSKTQTGSLEQKIRIKGRKLKKMKKKSQTKSLLFSFQPEISACRKSVLKNLSENPFIVFPCSY